MISIHKPIIDDTTESFAGRIHSVFGETTESAITYTLR